MLFALEQGNGLYSRGTPKKEFLSKRIPRRVKIVTVGIKLLLAETKGVRWFTKSEARATVSTLLMLTPSREEC